MLKVDQVEFGILTLVVNHTEPLGREFSIGELVNEVSFVAGTNCSDAEIVDGLVILHESRFIDIGKYVDGRFLRYDAGDKVSYFHLGHFRYRALPGARRRLQELSLDRRQGVFISHIGEEKAIALRLQGLLKQALPPSMPVFVSSDYRSIEGGDRWYEAILGGLKRSRVVIALLSPVSVDRRWINFETGIGIGQASKVIPVVIRGLAKSEIGQPLGQLQAREISQEADLKALLEDLAAACLVSVELKGAATFVAELASIEAQLPSTGLKVSIYRQNSAIGIIIQNVSNRPLDLIDAELLIPERWGSRMAFHAYHPVREKKRCSENGDQWVGYRITTLASQHLHLGVNPLPASPTERDGQSAHRWLNY